jgi:hypothetical protein
MAQASPEQMTQTMIDNMPAKTGKSLAQWLTILNKAGLVKHGRIVSFLKENHDVTHGFANLIAHEFLASGKSAPVAGDLVDSQYQGAKAGLRPIYDAVTAMVRQFGNDVDVSPKKTYVSYRRSKQFALIQPSTRDRVDVGLNLKGMTPGGRLEASGSFNAMCSHRVRLGNNSDVNAELKGWLKKAYDAA